MKKITNKQIVFSVVCVLILCSMLLWFSPIGFMLHLRGPQNYEECKLAGGEYSEFRAQVTYISCAYKGKTFDNKKEIPKNINNY